MLFKDECKIMSADTDILDSENLYLAQSILLGLIP